MDSKDMTLDILGTPYQVRYSDYDATPFFKQHSCDGYCDSNNKVIAVCNMKTYPSYEEEPDEVLRIIEKEVLRHEIIHAFLNECGLRDSSLQYAGGWAKNEEMIDFFAIQFKKLQKVFETADAL